MESKKLFAQTRPVKLFFIASIPGAISMLASALYGLFDGIFVGQFLGSTAFAAVNLAMPFVIINFALSDLIGVGSSVPISISLGQKRDKDACNIFTCAVIMIVGTGILVGTALFGFAPLFIRLMGAEGEFAELAVMYLRVYAVFSPITTIVFAMDNFLRISGYIRYSMSLNVMMSVFCAGIEFLMLGVLGWNIWAAALSNCLGMTLCAAMALIPFLRGKTVLRFVRPRFHMAMIRQIIACGLPSFLNNIAGRITSILLNAILVRLGGETAGVDLRRADVCRRVCPAGHVRRLRFPPAGGRLQLGRREVLPGPGAGALLLCSGRGHLRGGGRGDFALPQPAGPPVHVGRGGGYPGDG